VRSGKLEGERKDMVAVDALKASAPGMEMASPRPAAPRIIVRIGIMKFCLYERSDRDSFPNMTVTRMLHEIEGREPARRAWRTEDQGQGL